MLECHGSCEIAIEFAASVQNCVDGERRCGHTADIQLGSWDWGVGMRCHLMKDDQVRGVLLLDDRPREELIAQAQAILREWAPGVAGVEVWDGPRVVYRSSDSTSS